MNHLGSIQVVVDTVGEIVSYDDGVYPALSGNPWGIILNGRSINTAYTNAKYKFTGKERDVETGYYYFACQPKSEGGGRVQGITTAGLEDGCRLIRLQKNILDGVLISTH